MVTRLDSSGRFAIGPGPTAAAASSVAAKPMNGLDGVGERDETLADGWWVRSACWTRGSGGRWGGGGDGGSSVRARNRSSPSVNFDPTVCEGRWPLRCSASGRERVVLDAGPGY